MPEPMAVMRTRRNRHHMSRSPSAAGNRTAPRSPSDEWAELQRIAVGLGSPTTSVVDMGALPGIVNALDRTCGCLADATRHLAEGVTASRSSDESWRLTPSAGPGRVSIAWRLHCLASSLSAARAVCDAVAEAAGADVRPTAHGAGGDALTGCGRKTKVESRAR
jgi:hypothetical protein